MGLSDPEDERAFAVYDRMDIGARDIDVSDGITDMRRLAVKIYGRMVG